MGEGVIAADPRMFLEQCANGALDEGLALEFSFGEKYQGGQKNSKKFHR